MSEEQPEIVRIPLDGSYGVGPEAELVIITKAEDGRNRETSYTVPYLLVDLARVQRFSDANLILGFKVVKSDTKAPGLKELGL